MFDGAFLRDVHAVMGGPDMYRGAAIYRYDARQGRIAANHGASDGGASEGVVMARPMASRFPSRFVDANGKRPLIRARWRRVGADQFIATSEIKGRGRWRPHVNITSVRTLEPPR